MFGKSWLIGVCWITIFTEWSSSTVLFAIAFLELVLRGARGRDWILVVSKPAGGEGMYTR